MYTHLIRLEHAEGLANIEATRGLYRSVLTKHAVGHVINDRKALVLVQIFHHYRPKITHEYPRNYEIVGSLCTTDVV